MRFSHNINSDLFAKYYIAAYGFICDPSVVNSIREYHKEHNSWPGVNEMIDIFEANDINWSMDGDYEFQNVVFEMLNDDEIMSSHFDLIRK